MLGLRLSFGIDFCPHKNLIKLAILCYLINKKDPNFSLAHCYYYSDCSKEDLTKYINGTDHFEKIVLATMNCVLFA